MTALYVTVWIALTLFVTAEAGRCRAGGGRSPRQWARLAGAAGVVLMIVHVLLALALRYDWDHERAVHETARQAAAVYGFEWKGNIYVSYAFVLLWAAELWRWRTAHSRPRPVTWMLRGFFLVIIANGAVVFASGPGRVAGSVLVAALVWAWWPRRSNPPSPVIAAR
jgi:hypothetical protein